MTIHRILYICRDDETGYRVIAYNCLSQVLQRSELKEGKKLKEEGEASNTTN